MDVQSENEAKMEVFDSENELAVSLAKYTAELSNKFISSRGYFTVVLSGGSLITSLRKLLEPPYKESIEWSKWFVFWVDERVVPKDDDASNYKLALDNFLSKVPIPPGNVVSINDSLSGDAVAEDYEAHLRKLVGAGVIAKASPGEEFPNFDLMLLGMGPDGHVASLFPHHRLLREAGKWVAFIEDSPKPPPQRVTFTFPVINSSSYIALVVCGCAKASAVSSAASAAAAAAAHPLGQPHALLPVQMVRPRTELKWFLDKGAASML